MCLSRAAEERLEVLQRQGHVKGSIYRSLGQEAGAVGAAYALDRRSDGSGDFLAHTVRAPGALFLFGGQLEDFFRQYLARSTSPTGGKETDVHWGDFQRGFIGPVWSLGTMLEVMAGITLSFKMRGEERVGLVFHGDGATGTGAWHEGLNFAAVQRCPLVLVVENNQYAFSTPRSRTSRLVSFVQKAPGYGIHAESVDGTDVLAVYDAVERAAGQARAGQGVHMVELHYFRRMGHAQHDAQEYMDPQVIATWEQKDPVDRYAARILAEGWATPAEVDAIWRESVDACVEASQRALDDPEPRGPEALEGVTTDGRLPVPWTRVEPPDPRRSSKPA
jgi:pyruvate dehydrogenase E1 component alpha subunit/2-oxoisovalerate dehydrogenase E1 component alpha subunit